MDRNLVRCGFGLGNRVTAMANGLSRFESISFVWRNNRELPLNHEKVFPDGIPNVEFVTDSPLARSTIWGGYRCEDFDSFGDKNKALESYQLILSRMSGKAYREGGIALAARFLRFPDLNVSRMALRACIEAKNRNLEDVFILTDSRRDEVSAIIKKHGLNPIHPTSPEMVIDFDRNENSMLQFMSDWKTLLNSDYIVSPDFKSSMLFPFKGELILDRHLT